MTVDKDTEVSAGRPDDREVIYRFIQTNRLHRTVIERIGTKVDLQCSAHRMLMHVALEDSVTSQKDIAEQLKITPAAVATTLKRLECEGYVERSKPQNTSDSRANEIRVTERGRRTAEETEKYFRYVDSAALKDFSDEEIDTLLRLLDKMQRNLHAIEDSKDIT